MLLPRLCRAGVGAAAAPAVASAVGLFLLPRDMVRFRRLEMEGRRVEGEVEVVGDGACCCERVGE